MTGCLICPKEMSGAPTANDLHYASKHVGLLGIVNINKTELLTSEHGEVPIMEFKGSPELACLVLKVLPRGTYSKAVSK